MPIYQLIYSIIVLYYNRLQTVILTIRNLINIIEKMFYFIFGPPITSLVSFNYKLTSYIPNYFLFKIHEPSIFYINIISVLLSLTTSH